MKTNNKSPSATAKTGSKPEVQPANIVRIADYKLPTVNCQLPTANCQLPTANCQLPTANCQLPTVN